MHEMIYAVMGFAFGSAITFVIVRYFYTAIIDQLEIMLVSDGE